MAHIIPQGEAAESYIAAVLGMEEIIYKELKKRYFYFGSELARAAIRYPYLSENKEISDFYELLASNAFGWFCNIFCEEISREYDAARAESKNRAVKKYSYVLNINIVKNNTENKEIEIELSAKLLKEKDDIIEEYSDTDVWDAEMNMIKKRTVHRRKSSAKP